MSAITLGLHRLTVYFAKVDGTLAALAHDGQARLELGAGARQGGWHPYPDTTCAIVGGIVALSAGGVPPAWLAARERLG